MSCMHVREALHLLASFHFLASFLFLLRDIAHMIHIRYIAHMVQNLVKQVEYNSFKSLILITRYKYFSMSSYSLT